MIPGAVYTVKTAVFGKAMAAAAVSKPGEIPFMEHVRLQGAVRTGDIVIAGSALIFPVSSFMPIRILTRSTGIIHPAQELRFAGSGRCSINRMNKITNGKKALTNKKQLRIMGIIE